MSASDRYTATRLGLQRVATHILARARFDADGRFGLRVTSSGIGTPAFGPDGEVIRIAGDMLIREFQEAGRTRTATATLVGRSLRELAAFAEVELTPSFGVGSDTPDLGDIEASIDLDVESAADLMAWLHVGSVALDRVVAFASEPSVAQVWPEHFDIGVDVATQMGRVNLGASPGDTDHPEPYLYVSPWEFSRPGDPAFWNAPFGAVAARRVGESSVDPVDRAVKFFGTGLRLLEGE